MSDKPKKRSVVRYENMSAELAAAFEEKYPKGFSDYFPDLTKYDLPNGTSFYAVTMETEDAVYLVKINVRTDDASEIAKWLEDEDDSNEENSGEGEGIPDGDSAGIAAEEDAE